MNLSQILKQPLYNKPVSAQFISVPKAKIKRPLIEPMKKVNEFDQEGKENIELWLSFCAIGSTIISTGTKMLSHLGVIHKRDAVHDMTAAFSELRKHFSGNKNFDEKEREIDNFIYQF
ncbi:hypothetical protein [Chryseobacterium sp.]|uniref:hypothetical protein n=1 Tax=Chryseobacterium sp. TaxID=1871047 RepID=UPI00289E7A00|nr:hypothetical protein [Chryseobacterium sp.]